MIGNSLPPARDRQWTLLYYLNGDNNLREEVTRDLVQLHEEGTSPEVTAVASLYRGEWRWSLRTMARKIHDAIHPQKELPSATQVDWRGRQTFLVRQAGDPGSESAQLESSPPGEARPSDWRQLKDFLVTQMRDFPAQHYALFVASHGLGEKGILLDGDGQAMAVDDFRRALTEAQDQTGQRLEVVALEACEMGQPAVAEKLKGATDFLLASPEKIIADRAPYGALLAEVKAHPAMDAAELATRTQEKFAPHLPGFRLFR